MGFFKGQLDQIFKQMLATQQNLAPQNIIQPNNAFQTPNNNQLQTIGPPSGAPIQANPPGGGYGNIGGFSGASSIGGFSGLASRLLNLIKKRGMFNNINNPGQNSTIPSPNGFSQPFTNPNMRSY